MTTNESSARHRAPRRTVTAAVAHRRSLHPGSGRGLAVLASSGLVVAVAATSATAAEPAAPSQASADGLTVTAAARAALALSPVVTVPADAEWSVTPIVATSKPAPPPPPVVIPAQTARSSTRAATTTATRAASSSAPAPAVSSSAVVNYARQFIGTPYVYGGTTPAGFDCSGFTQYVYRHFGIELPRTSSAQSTVGTRVSAADAQPGDLVWWPGHIGIYTGGGNHIAARNPGTPLTEGPLFGSNPVFIRVG